MRLLRLIFSMVRDGWSALRRLWLLMTVATTVPSLSASSTRENSAARRVSDSRKVAIRD